MQSFRIFPFFPPKTKYFIKSFFYLLGFDTEEEKINDLAHKFNLFIDILNTTAISSLFLSPLTVSDHKTSNLIPDYKDFKTNFSLSLSKLIQIFHKCEEILLKTKEIPSYKWKPSEILYKAIKRIYIGSTPPGLFSIIQTAFQSVFLNNVAYEEVNIHEKKEYKEGLEQFCNMNGLISNNKLEGNVESLIEEIKEGGTVIVYGKTGGYKSTLIKLVGFLEAKRLGNLGLKLSDLVYT